ncbi:sensor histidine kinase [Algoriphagus confluentis]|uniref:Signal transduction histidine kinase internal region domain-containing protein n=1 Tax=Algoriphagus confluentis TaxID=1697556 RepID=A0ABQ6PPE6_9BACT|nr:hypothetical protein Aconfl_17060 [Algoriphagus confluentis]
MLLNAFSNPNLGKWVIPGAGLIWFLGCLFLLIEWGLESSLAGADAFFYAFLFVGGVLILDRVFSLISPKGKNVWLIFFLPISLSFISVWIHRWVLDWYAGDSAYREMLNGQLYLRWTVLGMAEQMVALLALAVSQLERQDEINKRESQMLELAKEAELTQLRQQLQPHFLFNSLNSINSLVVSQPQRAREMVLLLSDFLRGTIRKDLQSRVELREELQTLKMYLEIERIRFGHRLTVDFHIGEGTESIRIPQLLIQPLVENAIKHGLYGVAGEVKIEIRAQLDGNYLILEVKNPFDPTASTQSGTGFGLSSVERRLFLIFGRKDLLQKSVQQEVFQVTLKIPIF